MRDMRHFMTGWLWPSLLGFALGAVAWAAGPETAPAVRETVGPAGLSLQVSIAYDRAVLNVSGPSGEVFSKEFPAGAAITFDLRGKDGSPLPDGEYSYRLEIWPAADPALRSAWESAQKAGDQKALEALGARLPQPVTHVGGFRMQGGTAAPATQPVTGGPGSGRPVGTSPESPTSAPSAGVPSSTAVEPKAFNATDWFVSNTLGVGTDVPTDDIELKKASFPFMRFTETGGTTSTGIHLTNNTTGGDGVVLWLNTGGDFRITKNAINAPGFFFGRTTGRVGVNTTAPYQPLTVDGTVGWKDGTTPMLMLAETCCSAGTRMVLAHSPLFSNWGIFYDDAPDKMYFQRSAAAADRFFTVDFPNGRLGINTTAPATDLHVVQAGPSVNPQIALGANAANPAHFPSIRFFNGTTLVGQLVSDVQFGRFVFDYASSLGGDFTVRKVLASTNPADFVIYGNSAGDVVIGGNAAAAGAKLTVNGNLYVNGNITKTGAGEIVVMRDGDRAIQYSVSVGPEVGTYVRGTAQLVNGEAVIELPDHFSEVTSDQGLTVQLTLLDECNGLRVVEKSPRRVVVRELAGGTSNARFDYLVQGLRKGYEDLPVVEPR